MGFPCGSDGKASACNAGDPASIPGSGRSPGKGNDNPLQYSCLENSMDWGAWLATVHGVAKNRTWLSDFTFTYMKISLGISDFLEEISSLSYSIVFLYLFALVTEEGFVSPCYSLELWVHMDISFLFSFVFSFSSFLSYLLRPPQTTILAFIISFTWGWS